MLVEAENQESRIEHQTFMLFEHRLFVHRKQRTDFRLLISREVKPGEFTEKSFEETGLDVLDSVFLSFDLRMGMWYDDMPVRLKVG